MEIRIDCINCKQEILTADTDKLKSPLDGSMFKMKKGMQWDAFFNPHSPQIELTCPLCCWVLHEDGKLRAVINDKTVIGSAEHIMAIVTKLTGQVEKVEKEKEKVKRKEEKTAKLQEAKSATGFLNRKYPKKEKKH